MQESPSSTRAGVDESAIFLPKKGHRVTLSDPRFS